MPDLDLVALWEEHTRYEFETRDVDATMATMVAEPYVNHVPTLAGGVGQLPLTPARVRALAQSPAATNASVGGATCDLPR